MPVERMGTAVEPASAPGERAVSRSSGIKTTTATLNTPFYTWVVSPVCDRICTFLPSWVLPDAISFAALCCASTAAYLCCAVEGNKNQGAALLASAIFWVLYGILDNLDGKQARRLGLCTAGGDFFDHSSDSISSSFAALIILHMLVGDTGRGVDTGFSGAEKCVSLEFLRLIPGVHLLLSKEQARVCFLSTSSLNVTPTIFRLSFVMLSQIPFFVATWAHPIVGRTILSASIDGPGAFSVDELNLLVIPGLLLLKSYIPWIFSIRLEDLTAAISAHVPPPPFQLIGFAPSAEVMHFSRKCFDSLKMLQSHPERPVTLGFLLLVLSVAFSLFHSTKLLIKLMAPEHIPRFLPGVAFFVLTFWYSPPLGVQICWFSLVCLEQIAARLKLHVRSLLYLWAPAFSYGLMCLCLRESLYAHDSPFRSFFNGNETSEWWILRALHGIRRSYELHEIFSVASFGVLICCLFIYKHIINMRNHPRKSTETLIKKEP